jgi:hypothetical protein
MKFFYVAMIWCLRFELTIAKSTGRNPTHVGQLAQDVTRWEGYYHDWQLGRLA